MRVTPFLLFCAALAAQTPPIPVAEAPGPNLPVQTIRANDLIAVSVYDAPELSRTIRVSGDGNILLPLLEHPIKADGLLPAELASVIATALKAEEVLVKPKVTVTVAEYRSRPISVVGAVKTPTTFEAIGRVTLLEALARAGGLAPEAGPGGFFFSGGRWSVPAAIEAVCHDCLAKLPSRRPASVAEVRSRITRVREGPPLVRVHT